MKRWLKWTLLGVLVLMFAFVAVARFSTWDLIFDRSNFYDSDATLEGHPGEKVVEVGYWKLASRMFADGVTADTHEPCYWDTFGGPCYVITQRGAERIRRNGFSVEISGEADSSKMLVRLK